jgi:hypothetical protein
LKPQLTSEQVWHALRVLEREQHSLRQQFSQLQDKRQMCLQPSATLLQRLHSLQKQISLNKKGPNGLRSLNKMARYYKLQSTHQFVEGDF